MPDAAGAGYAQSRDAATTTVGDRVVVYHRVSRAAVILNPTATRLWTHLATRQTARDLAQVLCAAYPTLAPERAAEDVEALLTELRTHALLAIDP